ncbi:phospholipase [Longimycelium tulufanense]|uniref:Phospholipase n=1 Tax=Longimycelium tulufanense TaxID=907463 RepID=A0A8J3CC29_9PSEU|nr:phospholipase A2 [Longimycelium tulufanense]GGM45500.1 phospholipase [Longimycelium tulufanense]
MHPPDGTTLTRASDRAGEPTRPVLSGPRRLTALLPWRLPQLPLAVRAVAVVAVVFLCGLLLSRPTDPGNGPVDPSVAGAARVAAALAHPSVDRDPVADLPADFAQQFGYEPIMVRFPDGRLRALHPRGDCSAPGGATAYDFDAGCKAHDFGYDVLRYAERKGHPLGPEARRGIDDQLAADMHARCATQRGHDVVACHALANTYSAGLTFNSWRQRYGPPSYEPVASWTAGLAVIACLMLARRPGRFRAPRPAPATPAVGHGTNRVEHFLPLASILLALVGMPLVVALGWGGEGLAPQPGLWITIWVLQVLPLFFFAGGRANLAVWRAVRERGGGYVEFLCERVGRLLRPVVAFVLAWLMLPLGLGMLDAGARLDGLGWLVARPLWYLGVYLLVAAASPVAAWLHDRFAWAVPTMLAALALSLDLVRQATDNALIGYPNVLVVGLLVQQLGFCHADGRLAGLNRRTLALVACSGLAALAVLVATGAYPRTLGGESGSPSGLNPLAVCGLALAAWQIPFVLLWRGRAARWLARRRPLRLLGRLGATPVTLFLWHIALVLVAVRLLAVLGVEVPWPVPGAGWLAALLALVAVLVFVFRRLEHTELPVRAGSRVESAHGRLAAALGVGFAALGLLGFVATGFAAGPQARTVWFLDVDPMQNLLHLLLGVYLVRAARAGITGRPLPWLLGALASLPPLLLPNPAVVTQLLHGGMLALAGLMLLVPRRHVAVLLAHR